MTKEATNAASVESVTMKKAAGIEGRAINRSSLIKDELSIARLSSLAAFRFRRLRRSRPSSFGLTAHACCA
jgi:hypothetical protein